MTAAIRAAFTRRSARLEKRSSCLRPCLKARRSWPKSASFTATITNGRWINRCNPAVTFINANTCNLTISGSGNVTVNGNSNRLTLKSLRGAVTVNGNTNVVRWTGASPVIVNNGNGNSVSGK